MPIEKVDQRQCVVGTAAHVVHHIVAHSVTTTTTTHGIHHVVDTTCHSTNAAHGTDGTIGYNGISSHGIITALALAQHSQSVEVVSSGIRIVLAHSTVREMTDEHGE